MLKKPILAKCADRTQLAKIHPVAGQPESWFNENLMSSLNLVSLSFDFFINWRRLKVPKELWVKRVVDEKYEPWPNEEAKTLLASIKRVDAERTVDTLSDFCKSYELEPHYMLFKESSNWSRDQFDIADVEITSPELKVSLCNISNIRKRINTLRGGSVPIGPGGLIYGTSSLECFLSKTPDFWPGDVDSILVDYNKASSIRLICEFKKHTLSDSISFQTLSKYRDRDKLKYQSIGLLRDYLSIGKSIPIVVVYYPTQMHITEIKIEKIVGTYDNLRVSDTAMLPLPKTSNIKSCEKFVELLLNME